MHKSDYSDTDTEAEPEDKKKELALMLEAAQDLLDRIANDEDFLENVDHVQIMIGKAIASKKKKHNEDEELDEEDEDMSDEDERA